MTRITAVIPAWNKWELTEACLESLWRTTSRDVLDVLVVDNGSIDSTPDHLRSLAAQGLLRFLRNEENRGFAVATNQGIEQAPGDVLLLNNDIVAQDGWLEPLLGAFEVPGISGAGSMLLYPGGRWIQHAGVGIGHLKHRMKVWHDFQYRPIDQTPQARSDRDCMALTAACLLLKRSELQRVGVLDEGFRNGYEDVDLCLRMTTSGRKLRYCGGSTLIHHESVTVGRHQFEMENRTRLFGRWEGKISSSLSAKEVGWILKEADLRRDVFLGRLTPKKARILAWLVRRRGEHAQSAQWLALAGPRWRFWRGPDADERATALRSLGYAEMDSIRIAFR